jgi:hypothetical protein
MGSNGIDGSEENLKGYINLIFEKNKLIEHVPIKLQRKMAGK